ncbi:hypothetical protein PS941_04266 [Pseudomonas fluorescens]|jgi:hypothetical protein|uniref:Uncharacterized protein n=1 Tax=Pseudomonas fluorescens TaxID=294 RepID=A0A5E7UW67_PSEFL|nr:hypothetical protein PS941_04266 [Pseudomonas fluorescens]
MKLCIRATFEELYLCVPWVAQVQPFDFMRVRLPLRDSVNACFKIPGSTEALPFAIVASLL